MFGNGILEGENSINFPINSLFQTLWSDVFGLPSLDIGCMPICDATQHMATIRSTLYYDQHNYCDTQSYMAGLNVMLPGLGDAVYNHENVDVAQKLTSGILDSIFGFGTAAGQIMGKARKSETALYNIRDVTGAPMTVASRVLRTLSVLITVRQSVSALATMRSVFQTCMGY